MTTHAALVLHKHRYHIQALPTPSTSPCEVCGHPTTTHRQHDEHYYTLGDYSGWAHVRTRFGHKLCLVAIREPVK